MALETQPAKVTGLRTSLRALIFDVDGTLYKAGPVRRAILRRLIFATMLHPAATLKTIRILRAYRRAQGLLRVANAPDGDLELAQVNLAARISRASPQEVSIAVERWMEEAPLDAICEAIRPGLVRLLEKAKAEGLRLGICSDYRPERKLRALGILEYFDVIVCAQQESVGRFKPHPRGLAVTLSRLAVGCHKAAFIGDRPELDHKAASAAGLTCFIVSSRKPHNCNTWKSVADFDELRAALFPN